MEPQSQEPSYMKMPFPRNDTDVHETFWDRPFQRERERESFRELMTSADFSPRRGNNRRSTDIHHKDDRPGMH